MPFSWIRVVQPVLPNHSRGDDALFYLLTLGKQRSMVKARQGLDDIRWDSLNWEPPKLKLANFRVADKVCTDLTPLEAAFYLEIPFRRILSAMFHSMVKEGYLKVIAYQPVLRAQLLRSPGPDMEIYERMFLHAFADDNELSQQELEEIMNMAVHSIQEKQSRRMRPEFCILP